MLYLSLVTICYFLNQNNEKSYGFNNVVPIIASLERSVYDALGTADFRKYNSKMVQLWYNIKVNVFANKSLRVSSGC
jgi:hypothetical protein